MRYRKTVILFIFLLADIITYAQTPDMYPPPVPQPVEVDVFNIVLYVVLPILIVVAYIAYRRWQNKENKKNNH